jgi:hypothetical protein
MKICSKCKEERNDDEYYTYWHSTQQKYRTRHVCGICTRQQSKNYKLKVKEKPAVVKQEETKFCTSCKKDVPVSGYYEANLKFASGPCISCIRKNNEQKRYEKIMSEGGSERVCQQPNTYTDEYQKAQTFLVLERLGWTFNEDTSIWSKEGVKDKFGKWINIIPQKRTNRRPNGIIVRKKHGVYNYIKEIVEQKEQGMTYPELAYIYCCSHTTIRKIVNDFYREQKP